MLCRHAGGGNANVNAPATPDDRTSAADANGTPSPSRRQVVATDAADEASEAMDSETMPDPFPQGAHVGDENVIYLQTELIDTNRQFRYSFVQSVKDAIHKIAQKYLSDGEFQAEQIKLDMQSMSGGYQKFLHEVALYVYTNWNQKYQMKGNSQKVSFREYYGMESPKTEFFYVMIFLMRQQQWSQEEYDIYKAQCFTAWEQVGKPEMTEEVLQEFENVLVTADEWIANIISKEPTESTAKKQRVAKPDRIRISLIDVIEENKFTVFQNYTTGVQKVTEHFRSLFSTENSNDDTRKKIWSDQLAIKPFTMKLYTRVKEMFQLSNFRFKKRYPSKDIQWGYWILRAITNFSNEEGTSQVWIKYLQDAGEIPRVRKANYASFPLGQDFDSFEPEAITHNAMQSLSARIDRLNDW